MHVGNITIIIMSNLTAEEQHITCTDDLNNMHITCTDVEVEIDKCANCGKEDIDGLKACTACKMVKYCNRDCQIAHRPRHKKECKKRAAELHDLELFQRPRKKEDCPICMLPLPSLDTGYKYYSCCGKEICSGCVYAVVSRDTVEQKCPFCRTPAPDKKEYIERIKKRIDAGDAEAMYNLGCCYNEGAYGLPRDQTKAFELWQRAGELGDAKAYNNIGNAYWNGEGVEREKANHCYELAAMGGYVPARHNIGNSEAHAGNWYRAIKHWLIAAGAGYNDSVKMIQQLYKLGHATKDDYASALQNYQACLDDIKSDQRDKAAAYDDQFKYY